MRLHDGGRAPNPRRVRFFLAEKGLAIALVPVDLLKGEHRSEAFRRLNPYEGIPVLELDDGTAIAESVAICRYVEELHPEPPLFGIGASERAMVEMWNRRAEFGLYTAVQAVFRHGHPGGAALEPVQAPQWAEINRPRVLQHLRLLEERLATAPFLAGERFSIADITAFIAVDFMRITRIAIPPDHTHLLAWRDGVAARPGASA